MLYAIARYYTPNPTYNAIEYALGELDKVIEALQGLQKLAGACFDYNKGAHPELIESAYEIEYRDKALALKDEFGLYQRIGRLYEGLNLPLNNPHKHKQSTVPYLPSGGVSEVPAYTLNHPLTGYSLTGSTAAATTATMNSKK